MAPLRIGHLNCPECQTTGIVSHRHEDAKPPEIVFLSPHFERLSRTAPNYPDAFKCVTCGSPVAPVAHAEGC